MSARHWGPTRKSTREKRVPQRKRAWSTSDESKHPNKKTRRSKTESESAADTTTDVPPPLELEEDPQEFVLRTANMIRRALEWATLTERGAPGHIYTVKMRQDMGAHTISIPALEAAWEALRLSALSQTALSVAFLSEGVLLQVKRIVEVMAAIGGTRDYLLPPNTHNTTRDTILVCGRSFMELAAAAFGFQSRQRNKDVESLGSFAAAAGGEEGNNMPLLRPTCSSLFLANSAVSPLLKWTLLTACASDVPTATSLHFDTVLEALRLSATVCNDFLATAWLSGVDRASAPTMLNGVFGPTAWIADKVHGTLEATGRIFEVYAGNSSWTKKVELGQLEHCEALLDAVLRVLNGLHKADKMNVFQSAGMVYVCDQSIH